MEKFDVKTVISPLNPYVRVCLAHSPDHYKDHEGEIVLSLILMTEGEIDEAINGLIKELEKVGKKAKKELQNAQKNRFKSMPASGNKSAI